MKYTLCITHRCNFACDYCYIGKRPASMHPETAQLVIDTIFERTPADENIKIGFFGGEPLLEFDLVRQITQMIKVHPDYDSRRVEIHLVTNGSLYTDEVGEFVRDHNLAFGISCDGPHAVQDTFRRFIDGRSSSSVVETNIRKAAAALPVIMVNAVHHPRTFRKLPDVVDYFAGLGITQIYLSPDYSAQWSAHDIAGITEVYEQLANQYIGYYRRGTPLYISTIESKIAVIVSGGYGAKERCRMGSGELAFTPEGNIYPCERLIGDGTNSEHCIGNIREGIYPEHMKCKMRPGGEVNAECLSCGIKDYCMNWCGCSNYMATSFYNRVSPFLCHSEQAAIKASFRAFQVLENEFGAAFFEHLARQRKANDIAYQRFEV